MAYTEPCPRWAHHAVASSGKLYLFGGRTKDFIAGTSVHFFNWLDEKWEARTTTGVHPAGLYHGVCTSVGQRIFQYGGTNGSAHQGSLYQLNIDSLEWSQLPSGPTRMTGSAMVAYGNNLVHFGGFGFPSSSKKNFVKSTKYTDGRGWSNAIHCFGLIEETWFNPRVSGIIPPPCSHFTLTMIDDRHAVLFGGSIARKGKSNQTYLLDLQNMCWNSFELSEIAPIPVGRTSHTAVCLGYGQRNAQLLVIGGRDENNQTLHDGWLLNLRLRRWRAVRHTGLLSRYYHTATAFKVCPGLWEVLLFGGCQEWPSNYSSDADLNPIANTTVLQFNYQEQHAGCGPPTCHWVLTDIATFSSQLGASQRVREKQLLSQGMPASPNPTLDAPASTPMLPALMLAGMERRLGEAMFECDEKVREAEGRAVETERRLAQSAIEGDRKAQDAEIRAMEAERRLKEALVERDERIQTAEVQALEVKRRLEEEIAESNGKVRDLEVQIREAERRLEEGIQESNRLVQNAENRAIQAERRLEEERVESRRRIGDAEVRASEAERRLEETIAEHDRQIQSATIQTRDAQRRLEEIMRGNERIVQAPAEHTENQGKVLNGAEERATEAERRLEEAETRALEAERRLAAAERRATEADRRLAVSNNKLRRLETQWVVESEEVQLTGPELGRGGWATVSIATFRGIQVAAKSIHNQIVSAYNIKLFKREMDMAARLRHPNLLQFIGATIRGDMVILMELMPTSLRKELESRTEHDCMPVAQVISISLDVARALNYLHLMKPHPLIHRDISSANVLLEPLPKHHWRAKVSDYGTVNLLQHLQTVCPGNPTYAAPEAPDPTQQSTKMDIYSFGILLLEMVTGELPTAEDKQELLLAVQDPRLSTLIQSCISTQREERPSACDIVTELQD